MCLLLTMMLFTFVLLLMLFTYTPTHLHTLHTYTTKHLHIHTENRRVERWETCHGVYLQLPPPTLLPIYLPLPIATRSTYTSSTYTASTSTTLTSIPTYLLCLYYPNYTTLPTLLYLLPLKPTSTQAHTHTQVHKHASTHK